MKLHVHPEGIALLKGIGIVLFFLAILVLRFSGWFDKLLGFLSVKSAEAMESPEDRLPRRLRELGRSVTKQERRRDKLFFRYSFYSLCTGIVIWVVLDWFVLPDRYSAGPEWRWPIVASVFLAGIILIFVTRLEFDQRVAWKKWTFWLALVASTLSLLVFLHWLNPTKPRAIFGWVTLGCVLGALLFLYLFGMLRRIDRIDEPLLVQTEIAALVKADRNKRRRKRRR